MSLIDLFKESGFCFVDFLYSFCVQSLRHTFLTLETPEGKGPVR